MKLFKRNEQQLSTENHLSESNKWSVLHPPQLHLLSTRLDKHGVLSGSPQKRHVIVFKYITRIFESFVNGKKVIRGNRIRIVEFIVEQDSKNLYTIVVI